MAGDAVTDLARCDAEQAFCEREFQRTGCLGALMGVADWASERRLILSELATRASTPNDKSGVGGEELQGKLRIVGVPE